MDKVTLREKLERIRHEVGVFVDTQPKGFPIDVCIHTRLPVSPPKQTPKRRSYYDYYGYGYYAGYNRQATYAAMKPDQRWLYVSWLVGDKVQPTPQCLMMRYYALCAELGGARTDEAIAALHKLSSHHTIAQQCRQALVLACAATQRYEELNRVMTGYAYDPSFRLALSVLQTAGYDLAGHMLLTLADAQQGAMNVVPQGTPEEVIQAAEKLLAARREREGSTLLSALANDRSYPLYLSDDLKAVAKNLGLKTLQDVTVAHESVMSTYIRAFSIVARQKCLDILNAPDAQPFLDEVTQVMNDYNLMRGIYVMNPDEAAELVHKLSRVAGMIGVRIVKRYSDGWLSYGYHASPNAQAAIAQDHPIKRPTSADPRDLLGNFKYDSMGYNRLNPEQRWWYLDWLAGDDVKPLECFFAVRLKGLLQVPNVLSNPEAMACVERIFEQTGNNEVRRAAGYMLMQFYAKSRNGEKITTLFDTMKPGSSNVMELLRLLHEAGGRLTGAGLLWAARAAKFQHSPITREFFDEIAENAQRLLDEYEAQHGRSLLQHIVEASRRSSYLDWRVSHLIREIAKQAQKEFRDSRPKLTRADRMSAQEKEREQKELATFRTDETTELKVKRVYDALKKSTNSDERRLLPLYLECGASALESGDRVKAIAYLRRAVELDENGAAKKLLEKALAQGNE
jgi:hypothetical protein